MKMTQSKISERQSWTLNQKIDHAVATIETFINRCDRNSYLSFSGGLDSTVMLDIARRFIDKNFPAVFCNTGNEFPEIVKFVKTFDNVTIISPRISIRKIIEKEGFPLISKEQSQYIRQAKHTGSKKLRNLRLYGTDSKKGLTYGKISEKWKYLIKEPFNVSEKCCDILKKKPFAIYNKENNAAPIIGTTIEESRLRLQQYILRGGCNSFTGKRIASFPISIFLKRDIEEYIRYFNIPYCPIYDNPSVNRTGCFICGFGAHLEQERFDFLNKEHPSMYKATMNYTNNGITYREALREVLSVNGLCLPDERPKNFFDELF